MAKIRINLAFFSEVPFLGSLKKDTKLEPFLSILALLTLKIKLGLSL